MVWSNYFQNLPPAHRQHLLVEKAKQRRAPCRGRPYVLLKWLWQDGRLTHFLLWGFEQFWPIGHLSFSLPILGTSSSFHPYIRNPRLLGS